jgi:hypothetical protein
LRPGGRHGTDDVDGCMARAQLVAASAYNNVGKRFCLCLAATDADSSGNGKERGRWCWCDGVAVEMDGAYSGVNWSVCDRWETRRTSGGHVRTRSRLVRVARFVWVAPLGRVPYPRGHIGTTSACLLFFFWDSAFTCLGGERGDQPRRGRAHC